MLEHGHGYTVECKDEVLVNISKEIIQLIPCWKTMTEDINESNESTIPFPFCSQTFEILVQNLHTIILNLNSDETWYLLDKQTLFNEYVKEKLIHHLNHVDKDTLVLLLNAADFLDIDCLVEVYAFALSNIIQSMSDEDVAQFLL